jgi:hypothetical protein
LNCGRNRVTTLRCKLGLGWDNPMTSAKRGDLMFRCPITGSDFDSGFIADQSDLAAISPLARMSARCPRCGQSHALKFADAWIRTRPATALAKAIGSN